MVKSADRTMAILEHLAMQRCPLSHAQIAAALDIPGSSLTALLGDLVRRGYVLHDRMSRYYELGPAVMDLAGAYMAGLDLPRLSQPEVTALAAEVEETVALAVPAGLETLVVCRQIWVAKLTYALQVGDRAPIHAAASGKVILAFMSESEREALIAACDFSAATSATVRDAVALHRQLAEIRGSGIAVSREELIVGVVTAAVPVFDAASKPVAALSVSIPTPRFSEARLAAVGKRLGAAAARLSRRLGAGPHPVSAAVGDQ